jgi:hypothetical protein
MGFVEEQEEELTEEQRERIKVNRERALSIRRKRELEEQAPPANNSEGCVTKRIMTLEGNGNSMGRKAADHENEKRLQDYGTREEEKCVLDGGEDGQKEEMEILESFEVGAPPMITKREAMSVYCLPEGTLAVCQCVEKENPHRRGWSAMKLYHRSEIRRRARDRYGGLEGLISERKRREMKRCVNTMKKTKDIFKSNR